MTSSHRYSCAFAVCLAFGFSPSVYADDDSIRDQQEKQRQVQAETDHVVRRITTMMRVMQFYSIQSPEKEILKEMSGTLSGLSKNQMAEVIRQLESAASAKDEKLSDEAREKAYENHRQVLAALHEMVARFDAIKSLDQAADRFDKHAKLQLDLHLQTGQSVRDLAEQSKPDASPTTKLLIAKRMRTNGTEMKRQSDSQTDLERDVTILVKQVKELSPNLNPEQQERIKTMEKLLAEYRVQENLTVAARNLRTIGDAKYRTPAFQNANDLQWKSASQLQAIARVLRVPGDLLSALKEAREKIDQAIAKQDEIKEEVKTQEEKVKEDKAKNEPQQPKDDKFKLPGLEALPQVATPADKKAQVEKAIQEAMNADKNADLAKKQAKNAFDTKDTENLLKPFAKDAAENLAKAEAAMKDVKDNLLKNDVNKAAEPQAKATAQLKAAKADIEKMIAAAEKEKTDPLAALKKAIENLDNVIKEQVKTRDETKETVGDKQNLKLPELADKQKDLVNKTDDVKNAPLPNKEKVEAALDKATSQMKAAAKNLDNKKSPEAVAKQDKAIDALKEARDELAEKAAEVEKRRDDIAKLEDAAKKLEELTKQEKNVAKEADANADQPKKADANKDLAKEQGDLTPKANDLAKEVDKAAPKAAEKIAESTKNMEAAKKELDKNAAKNAAPEAKEAAKKLDDAQKALQNALNELKGKEIADQAAMQKKDQANTAQQVAKALEETQKAAEAAKTAEKADLAKQQADIAKQADVQKLPEAAKDAAKAAEALKNNDFAKALENQAKALEKLAEAAKNQKPMEGEGEPMAKQGEAKQGEAKEGEKTAQAKENMAQPGEAKGAEPMAKGDPMKGEAKAANAKTPMKGDMAQAKAPAGEKPMAQAKGQKAQEPMAGDKGQAKEGQAQAAQAKQGEPKNGDPMAQAKNAGEAPMPGQKGGQGEPMAQAKGEGQPKAETPKQLAQKQQALMDATKALAQAPQANPNAQAQAAAAKSQQANQAAQAALAQAQAQAPQAVQPQLQKAAEQLQNAAKQLGEGKPGDAGQNQEQAAKNLGQALDALNQALAQAGQPQAQPGQPQQSAKSEPGQAKEPGQGQEPGQGEGKEPGQGQAKDGQGQPKDGQGQAKGDKQGKADEQNQAKGEGDRKADGTVSNKKSTLNDVNGDGSFLHLPPRQRELIRQAFSGNLPPEYANLIQQYYINIARGRPAAGSAPAPSTMPPR
jgi:hypothetical protein